MRKRRLTAAAGMSRGFDFRRLTFWTGQPPLVAGLWRGENRRVQSRAADRDGDVPLHRHRGLDAAASRAWATGTAEVLAEHRRALREAWQRHEGVEVDTQGDAFFVAFARASDAVAAAADGQRALADGPVRVRMGLHTGEPLSGEEGYVGIRRAPGGADRRRRSRRPGAALAGDGRPRRRESCAISVCTG